MARIGWLLLVVLLGSWSVAADAGPEAELYSVPCEPTAGVWHVPPGSSPQMVVPPLAVVDTDIRPERVPLFLDGRFIGQADDFDGFPDFLYLKPGSYRLEARLGGYVAVVFEIEARPGCQHQIRHRMPRIPGVEREDAGSQPDPPVPFKRVYEPAPGQGAKATPAAGGRRGAPDLGLRPDLARRLEASATVGRERPAGAGLRLRVEPPHASVYIDGAFVATGVQLDRLAEPLPVEPGAHRLEVVAPGHAPHEEELLAEPGEVLAVHVTLEALAVVK